MYESRSRRTFWAGGDGSEGTSVEAWLLGRQQAGSSRTTTTRTPRVDKHRPLEGENTNLHGDKEKRSGDDSGLESGHCSMNTGED